MFELFELEDECNKNGGICYFAIIDTNNRFDEVARFAPGLEAEALTCSRSLGKNYKLGAQCKNNKFLFYK